MPSAVSRITGGTENTIVAKHADTAPRPKKGSAGIRYTKLGSVCIMSRIGEKARQARWLRANQIPTGMPITRAVTVDRVTRTRVSTVACHSRRSQRNRRPNRVSNPIRRPPIL